MCISVPNLVPIGRDIAIFRFFKIAAVCHLECSKVQNFKSSPVRRANMCLCAKFHADRSISTNDLELLKVASAIETFSKFLNVGNISYIN